jgi:hypothetical protein
MASGSQLQDTAGGRRRETRQALLVLGVIFFLHVGLFYRPSGWLYDPSMYYAYIRSPVIDGDLLFWNEAEPKGFWAEVPPSPTGMCPNVWSLGPALLWTPFFLLGHGATLLANWTGIASLPADGYSTLYTTFTGVASAFYGFLGVLLIYRFLRRHQPHPVALLAAATVWMAMPVFFYMYHMSFYAHSVSMFSAALFVDLWHATRGQWHGWRYVALGLAAGLMALMRWQNILLLVLPLFELAAEAWSRLRRGEGRGSLARSSFGRLSLLAAAALIVFSPQMAMWQVLYGQPFTIPQGEGFMQWSRPHLWGVLFSSNRGLFWWEPVAALGLLGLFLLFRRRPLLSGGFLLVIALQVYVNSIAGRWWGGGGFGPRRFDMLAPILAWGLAGLIGWAWKRGLWLKVICVAGSVLLFAHQLALIRMVYSETMPSDLYMAGEPIPWAVFAEAFSRIFRQPGQLLAWPFFAPAPFFDLYHALFGSTAPVDLGRSLLALAVALAGLATVYTGWLLLDRRLSVWRRFRPVALRVGGALLVLAIAGVDAGILVLA